MFYVKLSEIQSVTYLSDPEGVIGLSLKQRQIFIPPVLVNLDSKYTCAEPILRYLRRELAIHTIFD